MSLVDRWGLPVWGAGNLTRPVAAGGGTVAGVMGPGRASAAGGVVSALGSATRRETRFGVFLVMSSAGGPARGSALVDGVSGSRGVVGVR